MMTAAARGHHLDVPRASTARPHRPRVRAVSSTAVATPSAPGTRWCSSRAYWSPNRSRPVLLGGGAAKKGSPEQLGEHGLVDCALGGDAAVPVVGAALVHHARHRVDHGHARPGVEGEHALLLRPPRAHR